MATEQQYASNLAWARRSTVGKPLTTQNLRSNDDRDDRNEQNTSVSQEMAGAAAASVPFMGSFLSGKTQGKRKKKISDRLTVYTWASALGLIGTYVPFIGNAAGVWAGRFIGNTKYGKPLLIIAILLLFLGIFLLFSLVTLLLAVTGCDTLGVGAWVVSWWNSDVQSAREFCNGLSL